MIIDLREPVAKSSSRGHLRLLLEGLVGQPCVKVAFSYGGELLLHFGDRLPYEHPKMQGKARGSWVLGTRASVWKLFLEASGVLIGSPGSEPHDYPNPPRISNEEVEAKARAIAGVWVAGTDPLPTRPGDGYALLVRFGDGSHLMVLPSPPDEEDAADPVADWELFTPFGMYLQVGPGPTWSYLPSNTQAASA
jgi:hypothetical protein